MKFPTTESVCVTKQQLFAVILVLEVIPDPISVSINAHILPMEESVLVCRFLLSDASVEVAATTAPTESMLASSSVTETVFKQYNDYQISEIHYKTTTDMARFNDQFKCLPFDKIESIWYPFAVMSSRISLIVSCWYALNPKLETAPAVATNDIAPFEISNLRITTNRQISNIVTNYILRGKHTSI